MKIALFNLNTSHVKVNRCHPDIIAINKTI